jgi:hypothetical protein
MMKRFLILLFAVFTASAAFAQYPNAPNKMRLGAQTTGDGLIYRHAGEPSWTPTGLNNAWLSIDTLTGDLYAYRDGTWFLEIKGDLQQVYPLVINKTGSPILRGQVVGVDTSQIVQGDQVRIMPAIGDGGLSSELIMGVAANDIANDSSGYVAWFGYVREVDQSDIAQTGITLNVGDILYLSATEPGRLTNVEPTPPALKTTIALVVRKPTANNMTLLVRPKLNEDLSDLNDVDLNGINNGQTIVWDSINTKWIAGDVGSAIDTTTIATKFYVDSKVDSTRLVSDSILVYYIGGVELRRDTLSLPPAGVTSITAGVGLTGGTITSSGTIAADTAGVLVTKTFLTNQGYTTNTGTITGSGTTNTVAKFTGTTAIGNSLITDDGTNVSVSGTASLRVPSGTTAQRPGTPLVGMARNNTTNNNLDFYTGTAWENPLKSATATGLGTAGRVFFADANGRASGDNQLFWDNTNKRLGVGFNTPVATLDIGSNPSSFTSMLNIGGNLTGSNFVFGNTVQTNITSTGNHVYGWYNNPTLKTVNNRILANFATQGRVVVDTGVTALYYSGVDIGNPIKTGAGTITNAFGLNIYPITVGVNNFGIYVRGASVANYFEGSICIGTTTPSRTLHVAGEVRITDLTTDPPTRIVGADADGDLGQIRIGAGLTLSGDTLNVTAAGSTNLTFSGASSPVTLNSDTGTDVTFTAGDGISFSQTSNNLTISKASPIYAVITVDSNRTSTFLAASVTPDTIDNPKLSQVGGVFSVVGNGIQYTSGTSRTFLITANADFKFSEANNVVKFQGWRSNGGTVIDLGTFGTVESLLGNEIMHTSFSAITSLSNNDLLRFGFTPGAHTGDDDLVLTNLSITITQL